MATCYQVLPVAGLIATSPEPEVDTVTDVFTPVIFVYPLPDRVACTVPTDPWKTTLPLLHVHKQSVKLN